MWGDWTAGRLAVERVAKWVVLTVAWMVVQWAGKWAGW